MYDSIKNTLLAHAKFAKSNYEEISTGKYIIEFRMPDTYTLEFKFLLVGDQEQAEYKLYNNDEMIFWVMHRYNEAFDILIQYIYSL